MFDEDLIKTKFKYRCWKCGFTFETVTRPKLCPQCQAERSLFIVEKVGEVRM